MDAIECLKTRRSVREYKSGEVDRSVIEDIVECGSMAATARNLQPWKFVAITDKDVLRQIADITDHGKFIADASCCIALFSEPVKYYLEDGSAATQNMLLAAHAHGLASCWVAGDKKEYGPEIAELLGVPEPYILVSLMAVGHARSIPSPKKKPLSELLSWERLS